MKRTMFISAAALMLASTFSFTNAVPANAYGWDGDAAYDDDAGPYGEPSGYHHRSREDWRDLMLDQLQHRQGLRDFSGGDRWSGRDGWSDPTGEASNGGNCMNRRADYPDLRYGRREGRSGSKDLRAADRSRDDMQDWMLDRMERRALLREMLARQMQREDDKGGSASSRFEGADANDGSAAIARADLRDLILARIRSNGQLDRVLEQIEDRIEGED